MPPPHNLQKTRTEPELHIIFMLALASISGFITVGYMLTIPTDPTDSFVFGFSAKRTAILALIGVLSSGFLVIMLKALTRSRWVAGLAIALKNLLSNLLYRLITLATLYITLGFEIFILTKPAYDESFLDTYGPLYSRLSPPLGWAALVTLLCILSLTRTDFRQNANPLPNPSRIEFLDISRGFAILLAISSHIFLWTDSLDFLGGFKLATLSLTRTGTPTFIILTGMMVELVYLRIAQNAGFRVAVPRLVSRSLLCYLGGLGSMIILELRYGTSFGELLDYALLRKTFGYSTILQVYIFILILIIPILWLRIKAGPYWTSFTLFGLWAFTPLLDRLSWPAETSPWSAVLSILTGHPHGGSSFSTIHLLSLLGIGLILGYFLNKKSSGSQYQQLFQAITWMLIALSLTIIYYGIRVGFLNFLIGYTGSFRVDHHPGYYLAGTFGSLVLILFFARARKSRIIEVIKKPLLILGKDSLWAFAVGNSIIFLWPVIAISNILEMAGVWLAQWVVILFILDQKRHLISWCRQPAGRIEQPVTLK